MNPTQNFEFARNCIYSENIKNYNQMPLGRIRTRPSYTVCATHAHSAGSARVHSACGPWPQRWVGPVHSARGPSGRPRPVRPTTVRRGVRAHAGAVTALWARVVARPAVALQRQRWSKRRRSRTHGGEATRRAWGWRR
jgi:hypothetical protein